VLRERRPRGVVYRDLWNRLSDSCCRCCCWMPSDIVIVVVFLAVVDTSYKRDLALLGPDDETRSSPRPRHTGRLVTARRADTDWLF